MADKQLIELRNLWQSAYMSPGSFRAKFKKLQLNLGNWKQPRLSFHETSNIFSTDSEIFPSLAMFKGVLADFIFETSGNK